jgi:transposase InsO family protein
VFHSDRGCQYTSSEVARHLENLNMVGSMGRVGLCLLSGQSSLAVAA